MKKSRKPVKKVAAAGLGGGLATTVIWLAAQFGITMPLEVANGLVAFIAFAAGYYKTA